MAMAVLAVTVSSYPIIFCGKSFVSPVGVPALLYDLNPLLPGPTPLRMTLAHSPDPCAMLWWGVPAGFIESRSILDHGEIPLWNRYGHAGDVFLGQAVTMFGDPLQMIVILGHGSAGAWDIKFLLAKWLFCAGIGCLVWRLLGNLSLSLVCTALAAWCGAYQYIGNHPVFFVMGYAPWILLSALEFLRLPQGGFKWALVWLVANVSCFYAGHIEVAVVLIGGLNLAALINSLTEVSGMQNQIRVVVRLGVATLMFMGFTAPLWMSFLIVLPHAYATTHDTIAITQILAANLPGLFDDGFYRFQPHAILTGPGTSLLALAACLLSLLRWRQLRHERFFWINTGAIIFWAAVVFGGIPASFLATVPLLNRVGHLHVDFSYLLVIHITLQTAYGFKSLLKPETFRQAAPDFFMVVFAMDLMLVEYYWTTHYWPYYRDYFIHGITGAVGAPALFKYLRARHGRVGMIGWVGVIILAAIPLYRFGMYDSGSDTNLILPGQRVVLNGSSPVMAQLKSDPDTFRVTGTGNIMAGDYAAVYGLEDIRSCAPLSNDRFIELVRHFPGFRLPANDWAIKIPDPGAAQPLLNLLNVKYILGHPGAHPPGEDHFSVREFPELTVMENKHAWPRAFFASQIVPVSSNADFTRYLVGHGNHPFVAVDREETDSRAELRRLTGNGRPVIVPAEHYQLLPNSTAFDIHTTAPGVVCLTEGQGLDFNASANGQPTPIFTVNRAFKGIYLAKSGNYHVEFRFQPHFWRTSLNLFWLSTSILLILGALDLRRVYGRHDAAVPTH